MRYCALLSRTTYFRQTGMIAIASSLYLIGRRRPKSPFIEGVRRSGSGRFGVKSAHGAIGVHQRADRITAGAAHSDDALAGVRVLDRIGSGCVLEAGALQVAAANNFAVS